MKHLLCLGLLGLSVSLSAAPDVTSSLEYLFAPMESRYGTTTNYLSSRAVHTMDYLDGRIYIGGGDWSANTGPVPIISILPGDKPTWTNEYTAGAEHLEAFKKFSDGRIWTRATDPKEGQPNYGHFFAKYPGGDWVRCPLGKVDWNPAHSLNSGLQLYTHSWDICEYKKNFYFTGFGIGGSQYWLNGDDTFEHQMGSVTVGQTNCYYQFKKITGQSGKKGKVTYTTSDDQELERFMTLMPFDNGCIGVTFQWYESRSPDINQCYFWRRNESTGTFAREDCAWSTFMNGAQDVDHELTGSTYGWFVYFRKATPYKGRVYYIATPGCSMNVPIGFYSATMDESGKITSQRHAFDNGKSHVIDISVVGGSMYVMTVKYVSASSIVHGIWKTTDGQNFTQLATFTADQYFESFTYAKGYFYLGYGAAKVGSVGFSVASPSTDKAGQIWRFALPQADDDGSNDSEVVTPRAPGVGSIWMNTATITNDRAVAQIELKARGIPVGPVTMRFEVYSDSALTKFVSATNVVVSKQGSLTATVTGLSKKTKYYIRTVATTAGGLSTTSATANFTTTDGEDLAPVFTQVLGTTTYDSASVTNVYETLGASAAGVTERTELALDAAFSEILVSVEETRAQLGSQEIVFRNLSPETTYFLRTTATTPEGLATVRTTSFTTASFINLPTKTVVPSPNGTQLGYTFKVAAATDTISDAVLTFAVDGVVVKTRCGVTLSAGNPVSFAGTMDVTAGKTYTCTFTVIAGSGRYVYENTVITTPYTPPYAEHAAEVTYVPANAPAASAVAVRDWDFSNAPWFWGELNVTNAFLKGITGKGVKVGVVDVGCQPITEGEVTHLVIDHQGGSTGNVGPHGIGVCSIIKSDRFGIAPDCELYAYNGADFEDDIKGLWWCFTNGCRIVNFSGGYTPFDYTAAQLAWAKEQIRQMLDQGMILVASGGNAPNETLSFPQDMDGVINIAGIMRDCTSAGLNDNWAKDFAAFGNNVPLYTSMTGATGTNGGSSFAAPMVTAIAALYLQQNPELTRDELYGILKKTCRKLSADRSRIWGWGLVQADEIPADYKRQAVIDAEKAKWVKATKLTLANAGLTWNETSNWYEIKMYPGQSRQLKCRIEPENASDTNAYWYCGNNEFNIIGTDNVLTIPASLATGRFLVYNCRNVEREGIGNLKVFVVAQGSESEEDPVAADDPEDSWSYSEVSVTNVPDRTAAVMSLFNPASNRWGMADNYANARGVKCLANIDGRIYVGMGDWGSNFGPVPVVSIGIEDGTPTWRQEATIYTEAIDKFKKFSDGRVWAGCVDPRNYIDVMAAKRGDGEWVKTANVSAAPLLEFAKAQGGGSVYSYEHIWDFCEYKGSLFMGGYDIIRSDTWLRGDELMKTQAVCCAVMTNLYNCCYDSSNGYGHKELSRMVSLMPFENGLLCWQLNYFYAPSGEPESKPGIWRYDETTRKFNQELVEWDSLLPDWSDGDRELATSSSRYEGWVNFNDVVSFNGRLYYVVGNGGSEYVSIGFFSASMNATGKVESVNVRLDGGHAHVAAMSVVDGVMYCLAQHPKEDGLYKHSIWKTVDGVAFEKLAEIKLDHLSQAMAYEDGWFYVGLSSTRASSGIASRSGEIIRFSLTEAAVDPTDPVDPPVPGGDEPETPSFVPTNSWFTVDCAGAVFVPSTNYQPTVVGYCASNAYIEVSVRIPVSAEEPAPAADEKSSIYLAADADGHGCSFRIWDKTGWRDVANPGLEPTADLVRRVRMDLEKGTETSRRVRYAVDGKVLSADGTEWFEMVHGGDVTEILFIGETDVFAFFGEFCESFGGTAPTLEELLKGKCPTLSGYVAGGKKMPAFSFANGMLTASVAETVDGVYYTAFTSATLKRGNFKAVASQKATGAPLSFELDVGDAQSQFLVVVASTAPIAIGTTLE